MAKEIQLSVTLNLEGHSIKLETKEDCTRIIEFILLNKRLTHVKLSNTSIGLEAAAAIAGALQIQPMLEVADLSDMFTGRTLAVVPQAVRTFGSALSPMQTLRVINFSDNAFGPAGAEAVSPLISTNYNIRQLKLINNGLGQKGGQIIAEAIKAAAQAARAAGKVYQLEVFHAGRNRLENPGATALAAALGELGTLKELHLPQNGIQKEGIKALAGAVIKNPNLESLDLNDNTCTKVGGEALASALVHLTHLRRLDLGDCLLRTQGAVAVLKALQDSQAKTLEMLNLCFNEIKREAIEQIAAVANQQPKLNLLELNGNELGQRGFDHLVAVLEKTSREGILGKFEVESDEEDEDEEEEEETEEEEEEEEEEDTVMESPAKPTPVKVPAAVEAKVEVVPLGPVRVQFPKSTEKKDTELQVEDLVDTIKAARGLTEIKMSNNSFGVEACKALAEALRPQSRLEVADLSDIFTGRLLLEIPQSVSAFGDAFMGMCNLRVLDFSDNAFSPTGAEAISALISHNYHIRVLRFVNNGLGIAGGKHLAMALHRAVEKARADGQQCKLEAFHAGRNRLEAEGAEALAGAFKAIGTLKEIAMPQNGIRGKGISALAQAVGANPSLCVLDLNDNVFNIEGAEAMSAALPACQQLRRLDFGDCLMETDGTAAVCRALSTGHTALEELNLSGNDAERGVKSPLVGMLPTKPQLKLLDLSNNDLGKKAMQAVRECLEGLSKPSVLRDEADDV